MKIKTFEEFWEELIGEFTQDQKEEIEFAYEAGVHAAKSFYENDRIRIHEYYTAKVRELIGSIEEVTPFTENDGKLT